MTTIKELHDMAEQYWVTTKRHKFADVYVYASFLDLLEEFRLDENGQTQDGENKLKDSKLAIEQVWDEYLASGKYIALDWGFDQAWEYARDYFTDTYTEEIESDNG